MTSKQSIKQDTTTTTIFININENSNFKDNNTIDNDTIDNKDANETNNNNTNVNNTNVNDAKDAKDAKDGIDSDTTKSINKNIINLPKLDLENSNNWIIDQKYPKILNKKLQGPTNESNWAIPDILLVGGYPNDLHDIKLIQNLGIKTFVCLNDEYGSSSEYISYANVLDKDNFIHVPIKDMKTTGDDIIQKLCEDLKQRIINGDKIFLHCAGGHGRTGVVLIILLYMLYNLPLNEIFNYVQYAHDQRTGNYFGEKLFNSLIKESSNYKYFKIGQVPSPQTYVQIQQIERIIKKLSI